MSGQPKITRHLPEGERTLAGDVREGLSDSPKSIPPKHFYDSVGSELFELITDLPEYYPTRAEMEILRTRGGEIAELCGATELVELGSGSAEKALLLLEPMLTAEALESYVAVDVSESALAESLGAITARHPDLAASGHVADMTRQLDLLPRATGPRAVALLGGTVGNFAPGPRRELLASMADLPGADGCLLIGCDLVKDPEVMVRAYDDAQGVTARFNLNLLDVINRDLGADFDTADFEHVARWNADEQRIEMHLRARRNLEVRVPALDMTVAFAEGEEMLTETSAKFTRERIASDFASAGLEASAELTDAADRFALVIARRP